MGTLAYYEYDDHAFGFAAAFAGAQQRLPARVDRPGLRGAVPGGDVEGRHPVGR